MTCEICRLVVDAGNCNPTRCLRLQEIVNHKFGWVMGYVHKECLEKAKKENDFVMKAVLAELNRALGKHKGIQSAHEGYAVILEELDELREEIKKKQPLTDRMREEAIQVAPMGLRFVLNVCE